MKGQESAFSVAVHLVKLACERPDKFGRSLSQWDCTEEAEVPETVKTIHLIRDNLSVRYGKQVRPWLGGISRSMIWDTLLCGAVLRTG